MSERISNVAVAITKLVATEAFSMIRRNLIVGNLVLRDFEPTHAKHGTTINYPFSDLKVSLNRHMEVCVKIPDVTRVLAVPELLRLHLEPCVLALCEAIETDLLNLCDQFPSVGSRSFPVFTQETADDAEEHFYQAGIPASHQRYMVVSPRVYKTARALDKFSEDDGSGSSLPIAGPFGKIREFFLVRSPHVKKTPIPGVEHVFSTHVTHNLAFIRQAIALSIRRPPAPDDQRVLVEYAEGDGFGIRVFMNYEPNTLAQQFIIDILYGCGVLNKAAGVQVYS